MSKFSEKRLAAEIVDVVRENSPKQRWRNMLVSIATLFLGWIGNFVFSKIEVAAVLWSLSVLALADILFTFERTRQAHITARVSVDLLIVGLLWIPSYPFARELYRSQHAGLYSGVLRAVPDGKDHSKEQPMIGFPDGQGGLRWSDAAVASGLASKQPLLTFQNKFQNDKFNIRRDGNDVKFSTTVRDASGNLVVEIKDNHWRVSRSETDCWDKNYTNDALEVKDGRGRVVLQVQLTPSGVRLQGEWATSENVFAEDGKYTKEDGITPMFKYPSVEHWGEFDPDSGYEVAKDQH